MMQLTQEREARSWSKAELGRQSRVHPIRVGQIENRRAVPYDVALQRLAEALDWQREPADLLHEVDNEPQA